MTYQRITCEVRIAGRIVPGVLGVQTSAGFDQINATATIGVAALPSWVDERDAVTVWASDGTRSGQLFGGEVTAIDWTYAPTRIDIHCGDLLARTRDAWGDEDAEYTSQTSDAVIRNVLEKNAIPSSLARIEGSGWTVGTIDPVLLKNGADGYGTVIGPLDDLEGYRTFSLTNGTILRKRVSGAAGSSAALSYSQGVTLLAGPRHTRTAQGIVNKVIITGVEYEGLSVGGPGVGEASAANPYVSNVSGFTTETIQSNLIEDDATALDFATQRVADKNRRPEAITIRVPLDPRPQPGMTISVTAAGLDVSASNWYCQNVSHAIESDATTTLSLIGGAIAGAETSAPTASAALQLIREGEDTGSGQQAILICIADGSASFDPDGTIVSYAWSVTATGGTADPASGSGSVFRFAVSPMPTAIEVTLTVTDNDALTDTVVITQPVSSLLTLVEDLSLAYGDVAYSNDGELTWNEATPASGNAICLCAFAPAWGQAWGTDTGHVYATFDALESALVDLGAPHGAVSCTALWCHETDNTRLWAGFDDGAVSFGLLDVDAQTIAWGAAGTIPEGPIREIRESYGAFGELRATAGQGYYYSADYGASWALQHTFDTAWRMAAGFDTNLASGLNDAAPLYSESGTPPTVPGGVTHVRGLSFGWRQQELYAADDTAALYLGAGPTFDLTAHADTTAAIVNHMVRSGNVDRVVYLALGDGSGSNGFQKWIPDAVAPFWIKQTGTDQGYMIGYGALHIPLVALTVEVLLVDSGITRASPSGVWHGVAGAWTHHTTGLPDLDWAFARADPANSDHWILIDAAGAQNYYSADAGASWTQITGLAASGSGIFSGGPKIWDLAFGAGGTWCAVGQDLDNAFSGITAKVWFGHDGTVDSSMSWLSSHVITAPTGDTLGSVVPGNSADWVAVGRRQLTNAAGSTYWAPAFYRFPGTAIGFPDLVPTDLPGSDDQDMTEIARLPSPSAAVLAMSTASADHTLYFMADYTGSTVDTLTPGTDASAGHAAATTAGVWIARAAINPDGSDPRAGLTKITDLTGTPSEADQTAWENEQVYAIRADATQQQKLAVLAKGNHNPLWGATVPQGYVAVYGGTWSYWALPGGATEAVDTFALRIETIGRTL